MRTRWLYQITSSQQPHSSYLSATISQVIGIEDRRQLTSAAWVIRRSAIYPNDGFGTSRSACYGAVGGESMPDVGGAVGVGVADGEGGC